MPGTRCAVASCNNSLVLAKRTGMKLSFHCFPKDARRKDWIANCKRADKTFNPSTSCICSEHFLDDDFERDFQAEFLGINRKRHLKKTAIPTLKLDDQLQSIAKISRFAWQRIKKQKFIVKNALEETEWKESGDPNHVEDVNNATYYDEEENYETSFSTGIRVKVEPGLIDDVYEDDISKDDTKYFLDGCNRFNIKKEENVDSINQEENLDSMMEIGITTYIKEEDGSYLKFSHEGVNIKTEPDLGEDDAR